MPRVIEGGVGVKVITCSPRVPSQYYLPAMIMPMPHPPQQTEIFFKKVNRLGGTLNGRYPTLRFSNRSLTLITALQALFVFMKLPLKTNAFSSWFFICFASYTQLHYFNNCRLENDFPPTSVITLSMVRLALVRRSLSSE